MTTLGLDIGGTRLRIARVAADGGIEARGGAPSLRDPQAVLDRCLDLIAQVRSAGVTAIGIGVPGEVEPWSRRVTSGGYVDFSGMDFAGEVERRAGLPVVIENDGTMALLGEAACGAARGCANVVMLTIGTGIGGAVLNGGQILRGRGSAGQLGHLAVDRPGRPCMCGRTGCVETVSSGTAFGVHLAEAGLPAGTRAEDLLARGDAVARGVIAAWALPLRAAIDSLIAVCNPQLVVIGGGAGAGAVAALARFPARKSWFDAPVVLAELGEDAGVVGAAMAGLAQGGLAQPGLAQGGFGPKAGI